LNNGVPLKSGQSGSLKMAPFDRSHTTCYQSAIVNTVPSCTIFEIFDVKEYYALELWVRGQWPCKFMHDLYIAEIHRTAAIFLSLIVWVYLHSFLPEKKLRIKLCRALRSFTSRS